MTNTKNTFSRLGRVVLLSGLCTVFAGCNISRDYSREELAKMQTYTNNLDQVFANTKKEVWATTVEKDGRTTLNFMGELYAGTFNAFVKIYKDLPENSNSYVIEYRVGNEVLENEIHMPNKQRIQPTTERRQSGKTSYEVTNWDLEEGK